MPFATRASIACPCLTPEDDPSVLAALGKSNAEAARSKYVSEQM